MKKVLLVIMMIIGFLPVFAQKKIPFTQEMRDRLEGNELSLRQVQFYVSKELTLRRKSGKQDIKLDKGTIAYGDEKKDEIVVIPKETGGICESNTKTSIKVRFEEGPNRGLQFIRNQNNLFQVAADDWSTGNGKVRYDTTYFYMDKEGANAFLMVRKDDIRKKTRQLKKAKGLKVGGQPQE